MVVLGGLLSAVVLNMLVVPALFLRYGLEAPARRSQGSEVIQTLLAPGQ